MKKYVIRSIGWVYDDDWYNYDGAHDIEGVYDSREEAEARCQRLNANYLLAYFPYLRRYQLKFGYGSARNPEFVDNTKMALFLAKELGVHPHQFIDRRTKQISVARNIIDELKSRPALVAQAMKLGGLHFFKLFEFEEDHLYLFHFKKNPEVWRKLYEAKFSNLYPDPNFFYYYYDEREADHRRAVQTIKECYEYAVTYEHHPIGWQLQLSTLITGTLAELSPTPDLLLGVLSNTKHISYQEEGHLAFDKDVTPEELMSIDAVLKQPLLLMEKVDLADVPKASVIGVR